MSVITVTEETFQTEVLESDQTVLVDFWASWCAPCKMLSPVVEQVAKEYPDIKVCKVDLDEEELLQEKFSIMSIPTLIVFKDGMITNESVGLVTKEEIVSMLEDF